MAQIFHVTPATPNDALIKAAAGHSLMVSMHRPDQVKLVRKYAAERRADHGVFSKFITAINADLDWSEDDAPASAVYYRWLEEKFCIWDANATAIMIDIPRAPSQLNDNKLLDWPFPIEKGLPVYHMDGPISRLGRLLEKYPMVCVAWTGHPKKQPVGCSEYWARIDEIEAELGSDIWSRVHMLRGIAVSGMRPFRSGRCQYVGPERAPPRLSRYASILRRPREMAGPQNLYRASGGQRSALECAAFKADRAARSAYPARPANRRPARLAVRSVVTTIPHPGAQHQEERK